MTDRRRILMASAFFLAGVGLAFAAAALWGGTGIGVALLFLGLFAALLVIVGGDDGKPSGDAHS